MARREYLKGDARQRERAYSPAVKINGGTTIYLAGQTGYQDERGETYPNNFDGQARVAFERMVAGSKEPDAARGLIEFLASERASAVIQKSGMEPLGKRGRD